MLAYTANRSSGARQPASFTPSRANALFTRNLRRQVAEAAKVLDNENAVLYKQKEALAAAVNAAKEWHAGPIGAHYKAKTVPPLPEDPPAIPRQSASRSAPLGGAQGPVIAPRWPGANDSAFQRIVEGASNGAIATAKRQRK